MPLAVLWHKEGPLREANGGEGVVLKSVPVEFAYFVACLCVASFFFFSYDCMVLDRITLEKQKIKH